jgi:putative molybdopterin biosynthesis protein
MLSELKGRVRVELVKGEDVIVDEELAAILFMIDKKGSLLKASKALGIPYSRVWEKISRAEKLLGFRIVAAKRGRGGTLLTDEGRELLRIYMNEFKKFTGKDYIVPIKEPLIEPKEAVLVTGSHDVALELMLSRLRERGGVPVEAHWIGSLNGIASIILNEGDIAGVHLLDEEEMEYNITYFKKLALADVANLVRGYKRAIGFVSREKLDINEILRGLETGELRIVNRQTGSGTRRILDWVLKRYAKEKGMTFEELRRKIRGYNVEVNTHLEVGKKVASGEADVGVALKYVAKVYALNFSLITWEDYDFLINKRSPRRAGVSTFIEVLKEDAEKILKKLDGYEVPDDLGEQIG